MTNTASMIIGGDQGTRRELDFYPTPPDVTEALLQFIKLKPCRVWEPACGDGAMARVLERNGHAIIATDLRDTGYGEGGVNFLTEDRRRCDAIITNPPFNVAEEFIRRSLGFAPVVAMLLKSQYWHAKKRHALFMEAPPAWVLPLTWRPDFLGGERGGSPTMDVIWTVWVAGDTQTKFRPLQRPDVVDTPQFDLFATL